MYNRYIPQPDGSFRRNRIQPPPERRPPEPKPRPAPEPPQDAACQPQEEASSPKLSPHTETQKSDHAAHQRPSENPQGTGVGNFLRRLLPKDFDTGDLMIILLLLLMSGDSQEDQNTALLTLALYLFM